MMRFGVFFTLAFSAFAGIAIARTVPAWPYSELLSKSDIVLIVHAGTTRDANGDDPVAKLEGHDGRYLTPVLTKLSVLAVLKGDFNDKTYLLPHYRFDKSKIEGDSITIVNGPNLVVFETEQMTIRGETWATGIDPDYILFLKRDANGLLSFVTGQYDAEFSLRQMHHPFPNGG